MVSSFSALFLSLFLLFSAGSPSSLEAASSIPAPAKKVSLSIYYETLCPGCTTFLVKYLPKIFEKGLIDIVDLNLIPYGNAFVDETKTIICQHGRKECFLNTVEACAIHVWPAPRTHFEFIYCLEDFISKGKPSDWGSCLQKMPLQGKPVIDCYFSGLGQKLELQYANETKALNPPHQYVPWVTVNEMPIYQNFGNFIKYICDAYKDTPPPKACQELQANIIPEGESIQSLEVCYVNDDASSTAKISPPGALHGGGTE